MLSSHIKSLIIDMDGVIWKADTPIGDLVSIFNRIRERELKFVFATNNSTKTSEQYVERLDAAGLPAVAGHHLFTGCSTCVDTEISSRDKSLYDW